MKRYAIAKNKRIEEAQRDEATTQMLLEIRKSIVEETISMNPAFNYEGLDEEVAQALLDSSYYGERHRERLTRYARSRAVPRFGVKPERGVLTSALLLLSQVSATPVQRLIRGEHHKIVRMHTMKYNIIPASLQFCSGAD